MTSIPAPQGMTRRHFVQHMLAASTLTAPAASMFVSALKAGAADMRRHNKAAILLFMEGGPSTIDIWDMKTGRPTGGEFKPISTNANMQICEHLPLLSKQMNHLAVIRSMSTREADHRRARYYMHTGYVPNPSIEHPSYGAVVAHELAPKSKQLEIPPFVSIGGPSYGPGFLDMAYAPLVIDGDGKVRNLESSVEPSRLGQRMRLLAELERDFISQNRGEPIADHAKVLDSTVTMMNSRQMAAFDIRQESSQMLERYGVGVGGGQGNGNGKGKRAAAGFGRGCLMARRLIEQGVPFVEVDLGGWDDHREIFPNLRNRLPVLDRGMSALLEDLNQRGMLKDTAVIWMGDFGRTPTMNSTAGRNHWARSWSVVVGGAGMKGGITIGNTDADGTSVETEPYTSQDLMASVLKALGISLETTFTSKNNRPMKIANSGKVIKELFV